eukprot:g18985.t1
MAARKASASATGGRMLNPSVEPTSRRESAQARRDSEGMARRDSARATSQGNNHLPSASAGGRETRGSALDSSSALLARGNDSTTIAAALEARNQRRSIGLKRLSVNAHMKETLIQSLEDVARDVVKVGAETTGIDKLQTIMTQAKEKGLGVSNLFHFFLLQSDGVNRGPIERKASDSRENPEKKLTTTEKEEEKRASVSSGGVFKETLSSKTKAEASRGSRGEKKKSVELMPSLRKTRPSTATSKRGSSESARGRPGSAKVDDPAKNDRPPSTAGRRKSSMARRSSSVEEAMMRDRLITASSFQRGLTTLGFKLTEEETTSMFQQLDTNSDGNIDLAEFTRFCLEIPSITWKAERARRGILGIEGDRELDKAAQDMAMETVASGDASNVSGAGMAKLEPVVDLGKIVYRGEKFFWRTKDLIQVVIQLNETKGFLAVTTFHTDLLQVYPAIFVDPAKIPKNAAAVAEILRDLKSKKLAAKTDLDMGITAGEAGDAAKKNEETEGVTTEEQEQALAEKANMAYMTDYVVHRLTMPDKNGNLLQPDLTRPEEQVNPDLRRDGSGTAENAADDSTRTKRGSAEARPGLMRTTFDEWDTLLFANPPSRVQGTPEFAKTKKRESYFQEFCNVTETFQENRVKAHRLSDEAAAFALQVSSTLAPLLGHSASAPATLPLRDSTSIVNDDPSANTNGSPKSGSGRLVLTDDISARRGSATRKSLLESQSAPVLPPSTESVAA